MSRCSWYSTLSVIITKGETREAYEKGFQLLNTTLGKPFNDNANPSIFMTDNAGAEIKALLHVWPRSKNLLCTFHVLQSVWRWMWDSKHEIPKENRIILMHFFKIFCMLTRLQMLNINIKVFWVCWELSTFIWEIEMMQMHLRFVEKKRIMVSCFQEWRGKGSQY